MRLRRRGIALAPDCCCAQLAAELVVEGGRWWGGVLSQKCFLCFDQRGQQCLAEGAAQTTPEARECSRRVRGGEGAVQPGG